MKTEQKILDDFRAELNALKNSVLTNIDLLTKAEKRDINELYHMLGYNAALMDVFEALLRAYDD